MKEKLDKYRKKLIDEIGERSVQIIVGIIITSLSVVCLSDLRPYEVMKWENLTIQSANKIRI